MTPIEYSFQGFVDELETAADQASFERVAARMTRRLGFESFAYLRLTAEDPTLISSYPKSWTERYFGLKYQKLDPVVRRAAAEQDVFAWDGRTIQTEDRKLKRFFEEATAFGIRSGVTVPIRSGFGRMAAFTIATTETIDDTERLVSERLEILRLAGLYFHAHVTARLEPHEKAAEGAILTQRERQCLSWVARGKTVADVAVLVQISPRTVAFHLENARRKLNAGSIAQCVLEAFRLRELS
ncbi:autoinducer binding domain-containing protein [Bradyrhizobium elkanii]|uniref:LuxR family transcriptional activator of conjugal transfer of Ti plasmids n=1 Tax=Bradyrhizobium elkanii TaxID=29448 RepID=A0A8I1YCU4_BRAEL|nr:autoinducer binding domain-containing protein [Bradyrhizobium elkanii]MBP1296415.1 LuxR family transcriptional activator of conjugal transfer of Ti plasmids [Bradyrhizobium elkanii]